MPGSNLNHASHLLALPAEVHNQILAELRRVDYGNQALRALGQTCKVLLRLFQDELYHTLTLRADASSGRSLQRITAGPRASLVRRLIFRARDPRPAWERQHDPRYRLSVPSKQVLLFLHRFPNLQEFELDVDCKLDLWFSEHPEPRLYPMKGHSETYRFILDETLRALGRSVHHNQSRMLPKLTIRKLPPRVYRALVDHGLHALLSDLRSFHIELLDETRQPAPPAYCKFTSNVDTYFLSRLSKVRVLHLQANVSTLVGEGEGLPTIDFTQVRLPCLRKLRLEHFVLGPKTENFVLRHLGTLYALTFDSCHKDQSWSTLFRKVLSRKPSKLTRFEVSEPTRHAEAEAMETTTMTTQHYDVVVQDEEELHTPHQQGRTFPRVRVVCGHIWASHEDELAELKSGHSMQAWRQLQLVVSANKQCWERFVQNKQRC